MFEHLVVPVDLSRASFDVIPVAARMAEQVGGHLDVVHVVESLADVPLARDALERGMSDLWPLPVETRHSVEVDRSVAAYMSAYLERNPGAMIALSSHGHGRSAAVLGSTVDDLLQETFGPLIVIGHRATQGTGELGGQYVIPLDGSKRADRMLPIAAAWATEFGGKPWLIEIIEPGFRFPVGGEFVESTFEQRRSSELAALIKRPVQFEVLHGNDPAASIVEFADQQEASLIFMTTHLRTGFDRVARGSVAAAVVRHARVPVVMFRPPVMWSDRRSTSELVGRATA